MNYIVTSPECAQHLKNHFNVSENKWYLPKGLVLDIFEEPAGIAPDPNPRKQFTGTADVFINDNFVGELKFKPVI